MDTPFAGAIIALRQARPEDLVRQLNAVFIEIAQMSQSQVIAAWQTLDVLLLADLGEQERRLIEKFRAATEARMVAVNFAGENYLVREASKGAFVEVIGKQSTGRFKSL